MTTATLANTSMLHIRIDEQLKVQATETLAKMGLMVSDAVRVFLKRVVAEQQIPFAVKVPNEQMQEAMREAAQILKLGQTRRMTAQEIFDELDQKVSR
jgi:DNA-damage-inducible protein J